MAAGFQQGDRVKIVSYLLEGQSGTVLLASGAVVLVDVDSGAMLQYRTTDLEKI